MRTIVRKPTATSRPSDPVSRRTIIAARTKEISEGIWRLVIPLPGHSVGHVNVYALQGREGIALVDVGWHAPGSYRVLDDVLRETGASASDVVRVLVTHVHQDHCGLAGAIRDRIGAWVGMHTIDARDMRERFFDQTVFKELTEEWALAAGAPDEVLAAAMYMIDRSATRVHPLEPDQLLTDGDIVEHPPWRLRVLHTPGHTAGHVCFYEEETQTLFSGDHVFPYINTNPGYRPHGTADPIGDYLHSIDRLERLALARILPGHQRPVADPYGRLAGLRTYHLERLSEVRGIVEQGATTPWEVAARIRRSRTWQEVPAISQVSAIGETYGHLVHLVRRGELRAVRGTPSRFTVA